MGLHRLGIATVAINALRPPYDPREHALKQYLKDVINIVLIFQNSVRFGLVVRMIWVANYYEEHGKVRNPNFLSYTPSEIVKVNQKLGRANTNESTCLYLAESPQVAIFECKPNQGDRIIISGWTTVEDKPLVLYPINSSQNVNHGVQKATNALDKELSNSNEYFTRIIKLIENFIGSEFIKDVPKTNEWRYEYLYSAYFADKVMKLDSLEQRKTAMYKLLEPLFPDKDWFMEKLILISDTDARCTYMDLKTDWFYVDDWADKFFTEAHGEKLFKKQKGGRVLLCDHQGDGSDVLEWLNEKAIKHKN